MITLPNNGRTVNPNPVTGGWLISCYPAYALSRPGRRARNSYLIRTGDPGAPAIAERNLWKRLAAARSYHVEGCLIKAQSHSHTPTEPMRTATAANMGHIMFGRNKKHMPRFGSAVRRDLPAEGPVGGICLLRCAASFPKLSGTLLCRKLNLSQHQCTHYFVVGRGLETTPC